MYGFIGIASPDRVEIALDRAYAAGLDYTGLIPGRTADVVGVGFFTPRIHTSVGASREKAVEFTYRAEIAEWFSLQGSVQHIFNPGAASGSGASDATLLMFRANLAL
jgi:porin